MCKIKICGLKEPGITAVINEVMPDYAGFILSEGYSRTVSLDVCASMVRDLDRRIICTGVFVDDDIAFVIKAIKSTGISCVQLHGSESAEYVAAIRDATSVNIIKTVSYADLASYTCMKNVDAILVDSTPRRGFLGGDIEDIDLSSFEIPVFLAGGLNPENVTDAIRRFRPYGVDVSGGVETDGVKDETKIRRFVSVVRGL